MSLGVLNNLSAMYAENDLNKTSNSLNTVLQQLSSGSKINSGADDAAGLSLVNGLQANNQALMQSQTNASEGVGLLTVADGALSQVNNLLNRAVTLATESANGTLNSSQDTASNQEYQSILSEISNIGSTTTYNGTAVFGSNTNIYTGDSSTTGASVNDLNIRSLSSSNVGDTNGVMAYTSGASGGSVFVDLSTGGTNAASTDSLGTSSQTTTLAVNYMTTGSNGAAVQATANISVGAGTTYANTATGLISAINGAGLGLNASFGTAAQAGATSTSNATAANASGGGATDTGIIISGSSVGTGTSSAGELGALTVGGTSDTLGGTLSVTGSNGVVHTVTLGTTNSTDTVANLASTINSANYGITASTNSSIVNGNAVGTVLTFSSASSTAAVAGTSVTDASTATVIATNSAASVTTLASASVTAGESMAAVTVNAANQKLSGTLTLNENIAGAVTNGMTASISGLTNGSGVITLGVAGQTDTVANLTNFVNNNMLSTSGFKAVLSANGTAMNVDATSAVTETVTVTDSETAGATDTAMTANLTGTPAISGTAASNVIGTLTGATAASVYTGGTLNIGSNAAITLGVSSGNSKTDTLADLEATVNKGDYGVTASLNTAGTVLSFSSANSAQQFNVANGAVTAANGAIVASNNVANQNTIGTLTVGSSAGVTSGSSVTAGDTISFNNGANVYTTNATDGLTLANIATAISSKNWGISAAVTTSGTGASETGIMTFTSTNASSKGINVAANTTKDSVAGGTYVVSSNSPSVSNSTYYTTGITGSVSDTTTGGGTSNAGIVSNGKGAGGIATTSYSDSAGTSLASTDLSNQADAESALTLLNQAVTAVSAQDGYIGAQINQLNAVSSVLSTQSENVVSAQNAVQATDYAAATSNMSKYEILSQTGISALAQANSMQQEVTKLLQ